MCEARMAGDLRGRERAGGRKETRDGASARGARKHLKGGERGEVHTSSWIGYRERERERDKTIQMCGRYPIPLRLLTQKNARPFKILGRRTKIWATEMAP